MGENINNIHDKFIKESFSDLKRAGAFFEKMLPKELMEQLDLSTLSNVGKSYIDNELSEYFSDLVFEVSILGAPELKTDVVLLFEHKSSPDKNVMIQVGYYMFAHYHKCVVQRKKLKVIIPIIYYQGHKKWNAPQIWDIFKGYPEVIKKYIPNFHHVFIALHSISDENLLSVKNTLMAAALIAQKWRFNPIKLAEDMIKILSLFKDKDYDWNFFEMTFVYMLNASEIQTDEVKKILKSIPPNIKDNIMTTYALIRDESEKIGIEKGIQKGKIEGKIEGKTEVVISLNEDNIPVEQIAKYTKLPVEEVIRIINEHTNFSS